MLNEATTSLSGLPSFAAYLALALTLAVIFGLLYTSITPHREWQLMRAGVASAAISFAGALLGFIMPLAGVIAHSASIIDCAIWGGIALFIQLLAFFLANLCLPKLGTRIENNDMAAATFSAVCAIALGMLNAACMSY